MSIDGEPQFRFVSVEDSLSVEERAASFYASAVILVHSLYAAQGLDPSQVLTPLEIEYAKAQAKADEATAACDDTAGKLSLKPVMAGTDFLGILARSDWSHINPDTIIRLTELTKELPGNVSSHEPGVEPSASPIIKQGVSPEDVANMVRRALAAEDSEQ